MTKEEALKAIGLFNAYANGKPIQYLRVDGKWCDMEPGEVISLTPDVNKVYRVKPEPGYNPHDMLSFARAWADNHNGSMIKLRGTSFGMEVYEISPKSVGLRKQDNSVKANYTYQELCEHFIWTDTDTPVGVEIPPED